MGSVEDERCVGWEPESQVGDRRYECLESGHDLSATHALEAPALLSTDRRGYPSLPDLRWPTPVIPTAQEIEAGRLLVQDQPE